MLLALFPFAPDSAAPPSTSRRTTRAATPQCDAELLARAWGVDVEVVAAAWGLDRTEAKALLGTKILSFGEAFARDVVIAARAEPPGRDVRCR